MSIRAFPGRLELPSFRSSRRKARMNMHKNARLTPRPNVSPNSIQNGAANIPRSQGPGETTGSTSFRSSLSRRTFAGSFTPPTPSNRSTPRSGKSSRREGHSRMTTRRSSSSTSPSRTQVNFQPPASEDGRQPSINLLSCSKTECQTRSETHAGYAAYTEYLTGSFPSAFIAPRT